MFADAQTFAAGCAVDRHQLRFIVSPEDAEELCEFDAFTLQLKAQMEQDLETPLDWVAANHSSTDSPRIHIALRRGKDTDGRSLLVDRDYRSRVMRSRAAEIALGGWA